MIRFDEWCLPAGESHLQTWMRHKNTRVDGRLTYQYHKYEAALNQCKSRRRRAIDVGSHIGLWAYWMARDFSEVECFEPKGEHILCWHENMRDRKNAHMHPFALGRESGEVGLVTPPSSSGDTYIDPGQSDTTMMTLDSFAFSDVDLVKIDCEGYEAFVVEGAKDTIARCRPVVIVEQKPGHGQRFGRGELEAVTLLKGMGATQVWEQAGDFVMVFR